MKLSMDRVGGGCLLGILGRGNRFEAKCINFRPDIDARKGVRCMNVARRRHGTSYSLREGMRGFLSLWERKRRYEVMHGHEVSVKMRRVMGYVGKGREGEATERALG